jgi:hypothetical protein
MCKKIKQMVKIKDLPMKEGVLGNSSNSVKCAV